MGSYAGISDVKEFLGIESSNIQNDQNIERAIDAAEKLIERTTGRVFTLSASATARTFATSPCETDLIIDDVGTLTGLVVETGTFGSSTWDTVADTDYEVGPVNAIARGVPVTVVLRPSGWGTGNSRVRVTAKWGWPEVPADVIQATILQAVRLLKRKDSPGGVYGSADWGLIRVSKVDPDVMALVQHFMIPGFGG